jgi:murein DD-endopeptidase MepM/ murein hydrolase activator NlpD
VISGFGGKQGGLHNDGINIAVPSGTGVKAAENGVVAYAGNELPGFGNLLLIRHAGGFTTAYAHNQSLLVKAGENVRRGQVVAKTGNTGNVAKPQLHFEIRRHAKAVNPMKFLGSRKQASGPGDGVKPAGS